MKRIELFTFTYNDEALLPFFLKHYGSLVDKMTFIDSGSNDKTLSMLKDHTVIQTGLTWWDWDFLHNMRKTIWKNSEFDLVFFPDLDEFFYRPRLREFLEMHNFDVYHLEGWQMVSFNFPRLGADILGIKTGLPLPLHNKYTIFNPRTNIDFVDAHNIAAIPANTNHFDIKLLHYKYLGAKHMSRRAELVKQRVPVDSYCPNIQGNILKVFPSYYKTEIEYVIEIEKMMKQVQRVI